MSTISMKLFNLWTHSGLVKFMKKIFTIIIIKLSV